MKANRNNVAAGDTFLLVTVLRLWIFGEFSPRKSASIDDIIRPQEFDSFLCQLE